MNQNQTHAFNRLSLLWLCALPLVSCTNSSAKTGPNLVYKEGGKPGVVAKINGQEVTEDELIADDKLTYIDLKKREYEFKMAQLNKLLVEKFIGPEAKKANMSTEDYVAKNITKGEIKISDSEYKKFVAEKKIPEAQITPQLKERINGYLKEQKKEQLLDAQIAKMTKSNPVEVYFKKPKLSVDIQLADAPLWGDPKATVTVVEFSDFQCPFCSKGADIITELKKKYKGKIKVAFKNFPLPMHPDARPASEASLCINEQGSDKFWKFHDLIFKNQDKLGKENLDKYAKDVGANVDKFKQCVDAKKFAAKVDEDMKYGEKIGVRSTPTFFVNGQLVSGAVPVEQFSEIIDDELKSAKN